MITAHDTHHEDDENLSPSDTDQTQEQILGHILVVDDYPMNRLKLARVLQQQGHTVAHAENGRQALEMVREEPFDVVLLDLVMPEMDGLQVLEEMKRDQKLRHIPVIMISAVDEIESAARCIEHGAEDYLPKPFNPVFLRARLGASLQKKQLRDLERSYLQQEMVLRQNEKLAVLGRLSAGMAHELNNPAAALRRGADLLREILPKIQEAHHRLHEQKLSDDQLAQLSQVEHDAIAASAQQQHLNPLERSSQEEALEEWLDERGVSKSWELAPALVDVHLTVDQFAALVEGIGAEYLSALAEWLAATGSANSLLTGIGEGAERISAIVKALKAYVYLDQAPVQSVDIHEGLDNTLIMFQSRLRSNVEVERDYDLSLPRVEAYGSELNQVWTNIIDNALGAMGDQGGLTIRTRVEGSEAVVEIIDTGPGIAPEILPNIFDPFFTTKPPGHGVGMGLNTAHNTIVNRHKGTIVADSQSSGTRLVVRLPLASQPASSER
jgi:signal transduction histidine kinase